MDHINVVTLGLLLFVACLVAIVTNADELIVVSDIYDHDRRLRSFELLAELLR